MIYALLVLFLLAETIVLILLLDKVRNQKRLIRYLQEHPPPSLEDYEQALKGLTPLHREFHEPESYQSWLARHPEEARREELRQAVLRAVEPDLVTGDDGYLVYWPHKAAGFLRSRDLRVVAEELDRRNEAWDRQVREDLGAREGEG